MRCWTLVGLHGWVGGWVEETDVGFWGLGGWVGGTRTVVGPVLKFLGVLPALHGLVVRPVVSGGWVGGWVGEKMKRRTRRLE